MYSVINSNVPAVLCVLGPVHAAACLPVEQVLQQEHHAVQHVLVQAVLLPNGPLVWQSLTSTAS
eukprot:12630-Heterococcus_DN1.PRE.3